MWKFLICSILLPPNFAYKGSFVFLLVSIFSYLSILQEFVFSAANKTRNCNAHASLSWTMICSRGRETPIGAEIIFRTGDDNTMKLSDA